MTRIAILLTLALSLTLALTLALPRGASAELKASDLVGELKNPADMRVSFAAEGLHTRVLEGAAVDLTHGAPALEASFSPVIPAI